MHSCCRKLTVFAIFSLFFLFFQGESDLFANDVDDYLVSGIRVGAEAESPAKSRAETFTKARKIALKQLFLRLNINLDVEEISVRDILDMVLQERVLEETISGNDYFANLDVRFSKDFVQRYVDSHNSSVKNEEKARQLKFLMVPVLMDGGKPMVWEDGNSWRSSLQKVINGKNIDNFKVIEGDIFSLSVINSDNIAQVKASYIEDLLDKYRVDFVYIAFFSYNKMDSKVKLIINGFTKSNQFQYRLGFDNSSNLSNMAIQAQVAEKLLEYLSTNSLARADESDSSEEFIRLEIPVRRLSEWLEIEKRLQNSDFITSSVTRSISKDFVKVDISCGDSLNIVQNFAKIGFDLTYRSQDVYLLTVR